MYWKISDFNIKLISHVINSQSFVNFLGIYIYHDLSGVITVKSIVEIINSKLNVMYRKENVRHYTPTKV
jgi:hypothetical protein